MSESNNVELGYGREDLCIKVNLWCPLLKTQKTHSGERGLENRCTQEAPRGNMGKDNGREVKSFDVHWVVKKGQRRGGILLQASIKEESWVQNPFGVGSYGG